MNIFVLDEDPRMAAQMLCDKHVVKMILETFQLLCGANHVLSESKDIPYKLTHKNHPCSIWTRECLGNYLWLLRHGVSLLREYTHRYNKIHKCSFTFDWCSKNVPKHFISITGYPRPLDLKDFAQCMPDEYKVEGDAVKAYRQYYIGEKLGFAKWTKDPTRKPSWI